MNNSYKNTYIDLYDIVSKELTDNNISIDFSYNDIISSNDFGNF